MNPIRGLWRRGSEMEMKTSLFNCVMRAHGAWWLFSDFDVFESRERLLGFMTRIRRERRQNFINERTDMHKELCIVLVD